MKGILGFWWVRPERAEGIDECDSSETTTWTRQIIARILPLRKGYPEEWAPNHPPEGRELHRSASKDR